jgi:hypothetical protein
MYDRERKRERERREIKRERKTILQNYVRLAEKFQCIFQLSFLQTIFVCDFSRKKVD